MNKLLSGLLCFAISCHSYANASQHTTKYQSLTVLTQMAVSFLSEELEGKISGRVEVKAGLIDHRLLLPYCPIESLTAFLPDHIQNISKTNIVGIRCEQGSRWSVFVPIDVDIYAKLVVPTHPISRGEILRANDLETVEYNLDNMNGGFYTKIEDVVGKAAKRNIIANKPILHNELMVPDVVKRGENLVIFAKMGRLMVRMRGVAMQNGGVGETIGVKNTNSNKVIQAIVVGPNEVKVSI